MRHLQKNRKLGRTMAHKRAMCSNMVTSLFEQERIITTVAKAKEVRRIAERLITYAKKGDLHRRRLAAKYIHNKEVLKKLFDDIANRFLNRQGGYTRILRVGNRAGDNAPLCYFELTEIKEVEEDAKSTPSAKKAKTKPPVKKDEPIQPQPETKDEKTDSLQNKSAEVSDDEEKAEETITEEKKESEPNN